ncbi:hypothetical protein FF1_045090 [Malus domestica]
MVRQTILVGVRKMDGTMRRLSVHTLLQEPHILHVLPHHTTARSKPASHSPRSEALWRWWTPCDLACGGGRVHHHRLCADLCPRHHSYNLSVSFSKPNVKVKNGR